MTTKEIALAAARALENKKGVSIRLLEVTEQGTLLVAGADLMDGTPIYDVKPYVPYADAHPEALGGFASETPEALTVDCGEALLARLPEEKRAALLGVLAQDPRPRYQRDPERVYGLRFAGRNVRFTVDGETLTVTEIE